MATIRHQAFHQAQAPVFSVPPTILISLGLEAVRHPGCGAPSGNYTWRARQAETAAHKRVTPIMRLAATEMAKPTPEASDAETEDV
jgi:hypothetical protein